MSASGWDDTEGGASRRVRGAACCGVAVGMSKSGVLSIVTAGAMFAVREDVLEKGGRRWSDVCEERYLLLRSSN